MAAGFIAFELDLMKAVMDQLVPSLDTLDGAPLTIENAIALPDACLTSAPLGQTEGFS